AWLPVDARRGPEGVAAALEACQPDVVLTAGGAPAGVEAWELDALPDAPAAPPAPVEPLAAACLFRPATGDARTVRVTHEQLARQLSGAALEAGPGDRVAITDSLDAPGTVVDALSALLHGATACFAGDQEDLADWLRDEGATVWRTGVARFRQAARGLEGSGLRRVVLGGEPASAADARLCRAHLPEGCSAAVELHLAEDGVRWTAPVEAEPARSLLPIGLPAGGEAFALLDEAGTPVTTGAIGEIALGGGRRTGELGRRLPDGSLLWLGRRADEARVRGVRVRPAEVEAVLHDLPGVEGAAVVPGRGPDGDLLVAYVRGSADPESLRRAVQERAAAYMVPAEWVIVDRLPLTLDGRVEREALAPVARSTAPEAAEPRTPTERALAALWATELELPRVERDDHFFDIGGHSLRALRVTARVAEALGARVPLRALFEAPRLADYALRVDEALAAPSPDGQAAPEEQSTVLSFGQERLWFMEQLEPGSSAYNLNLTFELAGELDVDALRAAINGVVARHEVLRTGFASDRGRPAPRVRRDVRVEIPLEDLSALPADGREAEVKARLRDAAMRPFPMAEGPLLRFVLLRTAPELHVLGMVVHHMVFDGWSTGVFLREVAEIYAARLQGRAPSLPALPVQFSGFAAWQRERMSGPALERHLAFWRKELAEAPALLALPTDRPRPSAQTFEGAVAQRHVGRDTADRLAALTRRERVTQFMTLLAGYVALLSRYTGQDDVVVGAPTTGRLRPEHGGLIGFFINNLPLRARLDGDPTFREVLARVRSTTLEAHEHQEVPFERLVEELQPERTLSHAPIFQVAFDVHSALETRLELSGVGVSVRPRDEVRAPFDLNVTAADRPDGLLLVAEYNTALFDGATVERFLARLERLLSEVADHPERRLSELEWLAEDEREQVLTAWNRTALPPPRAATLPELVSRQAALTPHATAVRDEAGNGFTYSQLEARSNQVARWLGRQGVGPEVRVGLLLERGAEVLPVLLGILKAGGVYIPLDAAYPADRLDYMLHDSGATLLLAHSSLAYALPEGSSPIFLDHELEAVARESADPIPDLPEGENAAYIIYTSGSTGRPKGVVVQHRGLVHFLTAMADRLGVEPDDVFAAVSTVAFDIAALDLYLPLLAGASSAVSH
ncbi:MAG TPA: condensation domain-containing protein, partial [Longimicrobium sp.]|nr:condensation domain-containing protein [Longimicrobium sp.]